MRHLVELDLPRAHFLLREAVLLAGEVVQVQAVGVGALLSLCEVEAVLGGAVARSACEGETATPTSTASRTA